MGIGATSTTASLIASGLASENKKTLIFSTDLGPFDGVSITSDLAKENLMDDLVILASSGGVRTEEDFTPYVTPLSESLYCLKGTNDFAKLSISAVEAIHRITEMALCIYDYVVVDVYGERTPLSDQLIQESNLVVMCIAENRKHLAKLVKTHTFSSYLENKNTMLVLTKYQTYDFMTIKQVEHLSGEKGFYTLSEDDEIHKAVCCQNVADYVFRNISGASKGLFSKSKQEASIAMTELKTILADIEELFQEEDKKQQERLAEEKKEIALKKAKAEQKKAIPEETVPPEERPAPPKIKRHGEASING